jgi:hypothetical protein
VDRAVDWLVMGCYVACVYLLVRPRSRAIDAVKGYFDGMARLTAIATDIE